MKNFIIISLLGISWALPSKAQFSTSPTKDTAFYDDKWRKAYSMKDAEFYGLIYRDQLDTNKAVELFYTKSGRQKIAEKISPGTLKNSMENKLTGLKMVSLKGRWSINPAN